MAGTFRNLRTLFRRIKTLPSVRKVLIKLPMVGRLYRGWDRMAPFDTTYGIDTSGWVPVEEISSDLQLRALISPYGPSQPSIVRHALSTLGILTEHTFVDLGCGKGRVTIMATEFPFRAVIGVELSHELAEIARSNADKVAGKFPHRLKGQIFEANAVGFPFPDGNLVFFMYHSFGRELLSALISKLESRLSESQTHIFFVYYNPCHGDLMDASPAFKRWHAELIPYDPSELDSGPDTSDTVIIWQSLSGERENPLNQIDSSWYRFT